MNTRGIISLSVAALVLAASACKKKDAATTDTALGPMPDTTAAAAPAPLHVTDVSTGKGLTADKNLVTATTDFGVRDTIYVLVKTDGASSNAKLDAKWTYNGKQTVKEDTQNIAPTGGEARNEFHISKASAWPKGNYKVEIMLDGAAAGSKDFTVK